MKIKKKSNYFNNFIRLFFVFTGKNYHVLNANNDKKNILGQYKILS